VRGGERDMQWWQEEEAQRMSGRENGAGAPQVSRREVYGRCCVIYRYETVMYIYMLSRRCHTGRFARGASISIVGPR